MCVCVTTGTKVEQLCAVRSPRPPLQHGDQLWRDGAVRAASPAASAAAPPLHHRVALLAALRLLPHGRLPVSTLRLLLLSWCFTSTETIRLARDRRMEVSSSSIMFYVHRNHKAYYGQASGGVVFFHNVLRPQKPQGLLGTGE